MRAGFAGSSAIETLPAMQETQETWVRSLGREDPAGEGNGNPLPVSSPGKCHGQRNLVGYSSKGRRVGHGKAHKESFRTLSRNV